MNADAIDAALAQASDLARGARRKDLAAQLRELRDRRAANEWFVLLLGETSSGKSSWLNSLLDERVLPATPGATTGVPVDVRWARREEPLFQSIGTEGARRSMTLEEFRDACTGTDSTIARLAVEWPLSRRPASVEVDDLAGLVLVDAPGYNSCVAQHQEVLRDVLPEADAVLAFLNAQTGVSPADLEFLRLVRSFDDGTARHGFVINWLPPGGGDARVREMQRQLHASMGVDLPLYPLRRSEGSDGLRLWSADAWTWLAEVVRAPERRTRIEQNVGHVAKRILEELADTLSLQARVASASEATLAGVEAKIHELEAKRREAATQLDAVESDMLRAVDRVVSEGRDALWEETDREIEASGRFTEAAQCEAWIRSHLVPLHLERTTQRVSTELERVGDAFAQQLDDLVAEVELPDLPEPSLADPQWQELRDHLAGRGARSAAAEILAGQLPKFGGRGGAKAGYYNLAKKVIAKVGKVFGKKFSRAFYSNLGRALRSVGMSAGTAMTVFGAVLFETASYLYSVVRWKQQLRSVMQHTLGLPVTDEPVESQLLRRLPRIGGEPARPFELLAAESRRAVSDAMEATRKGIDANLARTIQVLAESLEERRRGAAPTEAIMERVRTLRSIVDAFREVS